MNSRKRATIRADGGESATESPSAHANGLHGGSEQIGGASRSATALPTPGHLMSSAADPTHVPQAVFRQDTGACSTNPTVTPTSMRFRSLKSFVGDAGAEGLHERVPPWRSGLDEAGPAAL
jgi:hypothetical protein